MLHLSLGLWNGWLLCVPLILAGGVVTGLRSDVARRMADTSGYTRRERAIAAVASLLPYPMMILSVWSPLTRSPALLGAGLAVYLVGLVGFVATLRAFTRTPPDRPLEGWVYRRSRNPLYVAATLCFLGLGVATASPLLLGLLALMLPPQHGMILAEERRCRERYGEAYERVLREVPRYLVFR